MARMRKTRDDSIIPDWPNHLVMRGNNRRRLFSYPRDYQRFLRYLEGANQKTGCITHALCLLPNHVHNTTTPPSVDAISACVKGYAQRYAQVRNLMKAASGKLFEQRFRSEPIADEAHLMNATMYIDANPIRAGLVNKAEDYPWSTYAFHAGISDRSSIPRSIWTPSDWYLSLGRSTRSRGKAYRELFEAYLAKPRDEEDRWAYLDEPYKRRLLRPDGSRASERFVRFTAKRK
jgi:putative transposase